MRPEDSEDGSQTSQLMHSNVIATPVFVLFASSFFQVVPQRSRALFWSRVRLSRIPAQETKSLWWTSQLLLFDVLTHSPQPSCGGFILMEKVDVNGPGTHPVYQFLKSSTGVPDIKWCPTCVSEVQVEKSSIP